MKKIFLYLMFATLIPNACKNDDDNDTTTKLISLETRNSYDDQAAQKFLQDHYFDNRGNLKKFNKESSNGNYPKLADLNPITLPSGVIYVIRPNAQPNPGTAIGSTDIVSMMVNATSYIASNNNGTIQFGSESTFQNTISEGNLVVDPAYYYAKKSILDAATTAAGKEKSFYEIEGFSEGLQYFKAFNMTEDENYNLQGVIIVPSRMAFARDSHYNYTGIAYTDRSFVFNFQIYKTEPRN